MVYAVIRFGNEEEGANGDDTIYFVRAGSHTAAASLVDKALERFPKAKVHRFSCHVFEIGTEMHPGDDCIVMGPLYGLASICNPLIGRSWNREQHNGEWLEESGQ